MNLDAALRTSAGLRRLPVLDAAVAVALVIAAYVVRAGGLGPSSLWLDDSWVALVHRVESLGDVWRIGLTAPGFAVATKVWLRIAGLTSANAQAIPFVAGILTPGVVHLVGRRLGLRLLPAALAGLLLVWSPAHAVHSVRVKQYTLDAVAVAVLVWLAYRASEDPEDQSRWAALAVAAMAATVASTSVIAAAAAIVVGALVPSLRGIVGRRHDGLSVGGQDGAPTEPGDRGAALRALLRTPSVRWVGGYLAFAVLWGLVMTAGRISDRLHQYWEGYYVEGFADLPRVATSLVAGLTGDEHGLVVALLSALFLVGLVVALRREPRLAAMLWGPVAVALVLAAADTAPVGTGRTDLYLYPAIALALAWTVDRVGRVTAVHVVALAALVPLVTPLTVVRYPQENIRPLVKAVEERIEPDDRVLLSASAAYPVALYGPWTEGIRHNRTALGFAPAFSHEVTVIRHNGAMEPLIERYERLPVGTRVWLLASHFGEEELNAPRDVLIDLGFRQLDDATLPGALLELWVRVTEAGGLPPAEETQGG